MIDGFDVKGMISHDPIESISSWIYKFQNISSDKNGYFTVTFGNDVKKMHLGSLAIIWNNLKWLTITKFNNDSTFVGIKNYKFFLLHILFLIRIFISYNKSKNIS